ncbi:hypothetical protein FRC01_007210 [Tulasnella sp. 417]|nr:hypothetical protein FRC01_007210 [Tulasnella sp. 417]
MEYPLQVYDVHAWSTKINFIVGSQIAEDADKMKKQVPVRFCLLTIVGTVYQAIFETGVLRTLRLDHVGVLKLLYTTLFHRPDQERGDPGIRLAIFECLAQILIPQSATILLFPEVTSNAFEKYGSKRIVERCTDALNHGCILGGTTLVELLSKVPVAHEPLFATGRLHIKLLQNYWFWTKTPVGAPEPDSVVSATFALLLLLGSYGAGLCVGVSSITYFSIS